MNATLLCPGPSLLKASGFDGLIVGVNRAATLFACDVWAAGDSPLIQREQENVIGSPLLLTSVDGKHVVDTHERDFGMKLWRGESVCWIDMIRFCPHALQWMMFSATAALVYCAFRGATRIDVYGADWSGTLDYDGEAAGKNRTESRWRLEREIWTNVAAWMKERGIDVNRNDPFLGNAR